MGLLFWVQDQGFRVHAGMKLARAARSLPLLRCSRDCCVSLRFQDLGLECRVWGLEFRVWGSGFGLG